MFKRQNYLKNLLNYLSEFKQVFVDSEKQLKSIRDYYEETYNSKSATDSSELLQMERLLEKFSYIAKYIDVSKDFYEVINGDK